jgi:hypothetical protein
MFSPPAVLSCQTDPQNLISSDKVQISGKATYSIEGSGQIDRDFRSETEPTYAQVSRSYD